MSALLQLLGGGVEIYLAHTSVSSERLSLLLGHYFRVLLEDALLTNVGRPKVLTRTTASIQGTRATVAAGLTHLPGHTAHRRQLVLFTIRLGDGAAEVAHKISTAQVQARLSTVPGAVNRPVLVRDASNRALGLVGAIRQLTRV